MSSISESFWRRLCESLLSGRTQVWMLIRLCPHLNGLVLGGGGLSTQRFSSQMSKEGVGHIEVYITLLCLTDITFIIIIIYKVRVCGNPALSKSISTIFPAAFAPLVPLCHTLVILTILHTFSLR